MKYLKSEHYVKYVSPISVRYDSRLYTVLPLHVITYRPYSVVSTWRAGAGSLEHNNNNQYTWNWAFLIFLFALDGPLSFLAPLFEFFVLEQWKIAMIIDRPLLISL